MRIENTIQPIIPEAGSRNQVKGKDSGFAEMFKEAIAKVNEAQENADLAAEKFAIGEIENIHDVTIATEQAKLALDLTIAVRNKVVDAYKEIMRMQF